MNQWEAMLLGLEEKYRDPAGAGPRAEDGNPAYVGEKANLNTGHLGPGAFGFYDPRTDKIAFNSDLNKYPSVRANTLAHEGQHRQYHNTLEGKNPRMTKEQYIELLSGYYFDPRSRKKEHTLGPGTVGYGGMFQPGKPAWPSNVYEKNKNNPLISNDYTSGYNGLLANYGGIEGMLSKNQKMEDIPLFNEQFPKKENKDWYYRTAFPETNWLKESDYPEGRNGKLKSQDTSKYPKTNVGNKTVLRSVLEILGF